MTPEREAEIRASVALTRYDRREPGDSPGEQIRDTLAALDAERERAARLERERDELSAQLVALREELDGPVVFACDEEILAASKRRAALLASTAPAVEEYTRRAQVEALHIYIDGLERELASVRRERDEERRALHAAVQRHREAAKTAELDRAETAERERDAAMASSDAWERDCEAVATALGYGPGEWAASSLAKVAAGMRERAEGVEAERDTLAAALVELRRCVLPCAICRGRGVYWTSCSMCGDSTFEHECDSNEKPCPAPACGDLRRALAALPADLAAAHDREVEALAWSAAGAACEAYGAEGRDERVWHSDAAGEMAARCRARAEEKRGGR